MLFTPSTASRPCPGQQPVNDHRSLETRSGVPTCYARVPRRRACQQEVDVRPSTGTQAPVPPLVVEATHRLPARLGRGCCVGRGGRLMLNRRLLLGVAGGLLPLAVVPRGLQQHLVP